MDLDKLNDSLLHLLLSFNALEEFSSPSWSPSVFPDPELFLSIPVLPFYQGLLLRHPTPFFPRSNSGSLSYGFPIQYRFTYIRVQAIESSVFIRLVPFPFPPVVLCLVFFSTHQLRRHKSVHKLRSIFDL